jgi:hypothetical protein
MKLYKTEEGDERVILNFNLSVREVKLLANALQMDISTDHFTDQVNAEKLILIDKLRSRIE